MATLEELVVKLEADNAELKSAMLESAKVTANSAAKMEEALSEFAKNSAKETSKLDKIMEVFAGVTLANLVVGAANTAKQAIGEFLNLLGEGIGEAAGFEQEMVRLNNSMVLNGTYTERTSQALAQFANDMEELSGVDDQVIASNLALLSSLTKLDSEGLQRAQKAALDLSSAIGVDLDTATKLIAKSSEGSTDAFKRYGIVIQETADKNLTFANTLSTIEDRFGGAAGANLKTFSGSLTALKNSFGNLFQAIGEVVTSNPAVIASLNAVAKIFKDLTDAITSSSSTLKKDLAEGLTTVLMITGSVASGVEEAVRIMLAGFQTLVVGLQAVIDSFKALGSALTGDFEGAINSFNETGKEFDRLVGITSGGGKVISDTIFKVADASQTATATMNESFKSVGPTIDAHGEKVRKLTELEQLRLDKSVEFSKSLIAASQDVTTGYQLQQESLQLLFDNQTISFEEYKAAKLASQLDMFAQEQAQLDQARAAGLVTEQQYLMASTQLQQQNAVERLKTMNDLAAKEKEINNAKLQGYSTFFGGLASLQNSSSKELGAIGKAAAISQATIDAYLAIQKTLATVPFPANIAAAAGIGVQAFANVSKIAGVGLQSGIDSVPGVGSADNFPSILAPGERVVPAKSNEDLTAFLERDQQKQEGGGGPVFNLNFYGPVWSDKAQAGSDIIDAINEAAARGMGLGILKA